MEPVITIPALGDNYIYLCRYGQHNAFVVDPGDAGAVLETLEEHRLNLTHALATHHHFDHTAGMKHLNKKTGCDAIFGEKAQIFHVDNVNIQIIASPGHTQDSVCYYVEPHEKKRGLLFTGDTLFIGGCGRPIECDASIMWTSLQKIAALPDDTLVYPGHDYTEENYEFALTIEPNNEVVKKRLQEIRECQKTGKPTVPSSIGQEKATNIFLRADSLEIKSALSMQNAEAVEVFTELRRRKNIFG
jgi:hydroxyacylglutathione hydrolase